MLGVFMERARAFEDLLVLIVIVALGARFIDGGDNVVWSAATILTRLGSFWSIMAAVPMVTAVIKAEITVVPVVGAIVTAVSWAMSARILVEAYFGLFCISVLIGGRNHLANPLWWLAVEPRAEVVVMESSDEGVDDQIGRAHV